MRSIDLIYSVKSGAWSSREIAVIKIYIEVDRNCFCLMGIRRKNSFACPFPGDVCTDKGVVLLGSGVNKFKIKFPHGAPVMFRKNSVFG